MKEVPKTYPVTLAGIKCTLPVREVAPGVHIAILKLITNAKLTEAVGQALVHALPSDTEVLVMPDGKAQCLLHVMQRLTGLSAVLARKESKSYMLAPIISTRGSSITTGKSDFFLDAEDVDAINDRNIVIVDDVVSKGGTMLAMVELLGKTRARKVTKMAVGTEGKRSDDVIALHHFPVYLSSK
jgi:adenine/guanine phosphoribosyltransferase-like PRPP-binding protein